MHRPIFVRELRDAERARLEASLRSASAFTVRRAQVVLRSASGRTPREIARGLCCASRTVRDAIRAFDADGPAAPALDGARLERPRAILHQSPRAFGRAGSTWTID